MSSTVDENKGVPKAPSGYAVPEGNVNMNNVEVKGLLTVNGLAPNQPSDVQVLIVKVMEKLMDGQVLRAMME
jgi:hypothetical protein